MDFAIWSVIVGLLLVLMVLSATVLQRLPLSTAMLYLLVGIAVSPLGLDLMAADPRQNTVVLERMAELVALTLSVVVASIVVHGISVTPLMMAYEKGAKRRRQ